MKKVLLSALMCVAGYAGAFASNEVNNVTSENLETVNLEIVDKVEADNNCYTVVNMTRNGVTSTVTLDTYADGVDDCAGKGQAFANLFLQFGYEITEVWTFTY